TLNIAGDLSVPGPDGAFIAIQNNRRPSDPASSGGSIGSNATLNITAANFSADNGFDVAISNNNNSTGSGTGGSIGANAAINFNITGDVTTTASSGATFEILNQRAFGSGGPTGGSIGGDATLSITAANF